MRLAMRLDFDTGFWCAAGSYALLVSSHDISLSPIGNNEISACHKGLGKICAVQQVMQATPDDTSLQLSSKICS